MTWQSDLMAEPHIETPNSYELDTYVTAWDTLTEEVVLVTAVFVGDDGSAGWIILARDKSRGNRRFNSELRRGPTMDEFGRLARPRR